MATTTENMQKGFILNEKDLLLWTDYLNLFCQGEISFAVILLCLRISVSVDALCLDNKRY